MAGVRVDATTDKWFALWLELGGSERAWSAGTSWATSAVGDDKRVRALLARGAHVDAARNPGLRVFPDFVAASEAREVVTCARALLEEFGRSHALNPRHLRFYRKQMAHLGAAAPPVNMLRVTGRYECADQPIAPWGYGDDFDAARLPEPLRRLADRAAAGLAVGALRDVTINGRHSSFFRLDAHVDPPKDGPNVCIVGLLSDTVLTLSSLGPPD